MSTEIQQPSNGARPTVGENKQLLVSPGAVGMNTGVAEIDGAPVLVVDGERQPAGELEAEVIAAYREYVAADRDARAKEIDDGRAKLSKAEKFHRFNDLCIDYLEAIGKGGEGLVVRADGGKVRVVAKEAAK